LNIAVVIATVFNNRDKNNGILDEIREEQSKIRQELAGQEISGIPEIKVWREAYSAFGGKPKKNRSSVENLYRMALDSVELRSINKLVDIYNLISLKWMMPVGGEDIDKMKGDLVLTFAGDNENPVRLLGEQEEKPPKPGEVIYKDEEGTVCRRWNWKESDRTKLTEDSRKAIFVIEALEPTVDTVRDAAEELAKRIIDICGGETRVEVLDREKPEVEI